MSDPWDPEKSATCLRERFFDFAYAQRIFEDPDRLEAEDEREAYGERRIKVVGRIDGLWFVVVYNPRDGRKWIISARLAEDEEKTACQTYLMPAVKPSRAARSTWKGSKQRHGKKSRHK